MLGDALICGPLIKCLLARHQNEIAEEREVREKGENGHQAATIQQWKREGKIRIGIAVKWKTRQKEKWWV